MAPTKNIVICCDGTSNKFGNTNTNVVKTFSVCSTENQLLYYDPGVGTMADINVLSSVKKQYIKFIGLGFGYGLQHNIQEVYKFLMYNYNEGDRVYLFGFSRGAYTVRVLSGLIQMCGLLDRGNEQLIPYAYEMYSARDFDYGLLCRFKETFSNRPCSFHYMGLWDSVSSVGSIGSLRNYPFTSTINNVKVIRHAIAIDEKRAYFKHNMIKSDLLVDKKEVWFAGVHGDVGGGNPELESGASKVALKWILDEAETVGLKIDGRKYTEVVEGLTPVKKQKKKGMSQPDALADLHKNNFLKWGLLEFVPRRRIIYTEGQKSTSWYIPWFGRREIPEESLIHETVEIRKNKLGYHPGNLPKAYTLIKSNKNGL